MKFDTEGVNRDAAAGGAPASQRSEHGGAAGGPRLGKHAEVPDYRSKPSRPVRENPRKRLYGEALGEIGGLSFVGADGQRYQAPAREVRLTETNYKGQVKVVLTPDEINARRWDSYYRARALFRSFGKTETGELDSKGRPQYRWNYRLGDCHSPIPGKGVELWRKDKSLTVHKVARCGNAYFCSCCGTKVAAIRRKTIELAQKAVFDNPAEGARRGSTWMLTLTVPHKAWDKIEDLFANLRQALDHLTGNGDLFKAGRWVSKKKGGTKYWRAGKMDPYGFVGHIVATEVTWSQHNGFHPHFHCLLAFDREIGTGKVQNDRGEWVLDENSEEGVLKRMFLDNWKSSLTKAGLPLPERRVGDEDPDRFLVDFREALDADEYLTKFGFEKESNWSVTNELVSNTKRGRKADSKTLFDLVDLAVAGFDGTKPVIDGRFAQLVRSAADALKGRPVVTFSRRLQKHIVETCGLANWASLAELTEEQASELKDQEATLFAVIPSDVWIEVLRSRDVFAFFSECLSSSAEEACQRVLKTIADRRAGASP